MYYYLFAFIALLLLELLYFRLARMFNIVDTPNYRSSHTRPVLLGGGIIFFLSLLFYFFTNQFSFPFFMMGATVVAVVSFVDDLRGVPSYLRLLAQVLAIGLCFGMQVVGMELWKDLLIMIVFVAVLNIFNFMDGINGMLALSSLVFLATFGLMDLFLLPFIDIRFIVTVFLSVLLFAFFNCRRKARCFSGDVGSVVMGLIVLFVLVSYVKASPSATPSVSYLTFVMVFLADGGLTVLKRFLNGKNIFQPHREHMYETLVNELKVPHLKVSVGYALVQAAINGGYFLVSDKNLYCFVCAVLLVLVYGLFFFFFNRKSEKDVK